jgi:hypothetical protein
MCRHPEGPARLRRQASRWVSTRGLVTFLSIPSCTYRTPQALVSRLAPLFSVLVSRPSWSVCPLQCPPPSIEPCPSVPVPAGVCAGASNVGALPVHPREQQRLAQGYHEAIHDLLRYALIYKDHSH